MEKYLKVMFGNKSLAGNGFEYKIGEINESNMWNPKADNSQDIGGFSISIESQILRWLVRGDTLYDVIIPEDGEVIKIDNTSTPNGVYKANKIILKNPRKVTEDVAMELYRKSDLPEKSYFKALTGCAIRGNINTAMCILNEKVNSENVEIAISEFIDFCTPKDSESFDASNLGDNCKKIYEKLLEIKEKNSK